MKPISFWLLVFVLLPWVGWGQVITTIAGNGTIGYSGDKGPSILAEFNRPSVLRFDRLGNMYIADWVNNVIRKINTLDIVTTVVGNGYGAGTSTGGYTGDGGPATAAELFGPGDIAFDKVGNMYVADNGNAAIRKVDTAGIITTIAGTGMFGYNGDNIPATSAQLSFPLGLVFDSLGNLYFSDEGNRRVRKINSMGIITTIAGNGTGGNGGDGGPATTAQLRQPCFLAISPAGDIYIPDWANHTVRKVNSAGIITTVAGNAAAATYGDGGPATAANISGCSAVIFDAAGNYIISNVISCAIRKVNTLGIITTIIGTDSCGFSGDGGPATAAQIQSDAVCSAVDAAGNLYLTDERNNRIRKVSYHNIDVKEVNNVASNISLYPNPAITEITITAPNKIKEVSVWNMVGQKECTKECNTLKTELNISGLPAGVYFVRVVDEDGGVVVRRVVKE